MLLCSWHIQRNLISKLSGLSKKNKEIYDMILNLPFITCQDKFNEVLKEVDSSEEITKVEKDYLKTKLESKVRLAKCFTKVTFCGGVCTTSRIQGLHGVLKKYLNSNSSLLKIFNCFRQIENIQLTKFEKEYNRKNKKFTELDSLPLQEIKSKFSDYVYKKLAPKFSRALNYVLENHNKKNVW